MKKCILFFSLIVTLIACNKEDEALAISGDNYNREALLTNWANNIIIPSYQDYQTKVTSLQTAVNTFNASVDQTNLELVREKWLDAYKAFQYVGFFEFGKAEEIHFNSTTNIYPTNAVGINDNIASGTYNFSLLSQFDKQGLPALDYMLHGLATTDAAILDFYTTNANATKYKNYLNALVTRLNLNIDAIVTDWTTNYKSQYIANNGNSITSAVNITVNNYIKYYEKNIRAGKVGIPAGIYSNGSVFAEKVEGFYRNDVSKILINEAIKATQDFFNGKKFNATTEGESLKSYLVFLNATRNGLNLSTIINNQFATINSTDALLNSSFSTQVTSDNSKMIAAFDAMQQNVVYFKLDMLQAMNITVDYVDADGD